MRKILPVLLCFVLLTGCGVSTPQHTVKFESGEEVTVADIDCVAVYTEYTNGSDETAVPADEVEVKAFQNGTELSPIVPTGEKTNGYIQCDTSVQAGTTAKVAWIFQLDDKSDISVEITGGNEEKIVLK